MGTGTQIGKTIETHRETVAPPKSKSCPDDPNPMPVDRLPN